MKCSKCKSGKVQSWKIQLEILTNHGTIWTTFLGNSGKCSQWEVGSGSPLPDWFIHAGGVPRRYVTYNPSGIHWDMGSVRWPAMHILAFNETFGPLSNFNSYTANTGIGLHFSGDYHAGELWLCHQKWQLQFWMSEYCCYLSQKQKLDWSTLICNFLQQEIEREHL